MGAIPNTNIYHFLMKKIEGTKLFTCLIILIINILINIENYIIILVSDLKLRCRAIMINYIRFCAYVIIALFATQSKCSQHVNGFVPYMKM